MDMFSSYLFGSSARGDSSRYSDIDILVVCENSDDIDMHNFKLSTGVMNNYLPLDYSFYSENRLRKMYDQGDLFAWHLYMEATFIEGDFDRLTNLGKPNPYVGFEQDAVPLLDLLLSIKKSVKESSMNLIYEAGLAYVCARNIAMSASYFSKKGVSFNVYAPLTLSTYHNPFPLNQDQYDSLRQARLASTRGMPSPEITIVDLYEYIESLINWAQLEIANVRRLNCEKAIF